MRDAELFGGQVPSGITVDFPAVMERVRRVRARLTERVSAERLVAMGIDVYLGEARFAGPDSVTVGAKVLRFKKRSDRDRGASRASARSLGSRKPAS